MDFMCGGQLIQYNTANGDKNEQETIIGIHLFFHRRAKWGQCRQRHLWNVFDAREEKAICWSWQRLSKKARKQLLAGQNAACKSIPANQHKPKGDVHRKGHLYWLRIHLKPCKHNGKQSEVEIADKVACGMRWEIAPASQQTARLEGY